MKTISLLPLFLAYLAVPSLAQTPPRRSVGYVMSAHARRRGYEPSMFPVSSLTHLNYASAHVDLSGNLRWREPWEDIGKSFPGDNATQPFRGNVWQINVVLKQKKPSLKTLLSVGGWMGSKNVSDVASRDKTRKQFAKSVAQFVQTYGFDGVDLDWRFPGEPGAEGNSRRPDDGFNYVLLLREVRKALQGLPGPKRLLTVAVPPCSTKYRHFDLAKMDPLVDFVNLMSYDHYGFWNKVTGHLSNLYRNPADPERPASSIDGALEDFLRQGFSRDKIVVGVPLYGRAFSNVPQTNQGLFQPFQGTPEGTLGDQGNWDYREVKQRLASGNYTRFMDQTSKAVFAYSAKERVWVSYEDETSLGEKIAFVRHHRLGGFNLWELGGDDDNEFAKFIAKKYLKA